jgi:hypothetical protein
MQLFYGFIANLMNYNSWAKKFSYFKLIYRYNFILYAISFYVVDTGSGEELHNFCSSPNVIRIISSRRICWTEHIACLEERRNAYRVLVGSQEERDH